MTLINLLMKMDTDGKTSHGDLVTKVARLAQCLLNAAPGENGPCGDVIAITESALAAALEADHAVVCHLERIAFLEQLCGTDALTGVLNRRGFEAEMERALAAAKRYGEGGVLLYVDLDGFKPINDHHGHAAGDAVLVHVSGLLRDHVRGSDIVGRLGGDEFAVLLTRTSWDDGIARAMSLEDVVNRSSVIWQGAAIPVRASFGYKAYGANDRVARLLAAADAAMYVSKKGQSIQRTPRIVAAE